MMTTQAIKADKVVGSNIRAARKAQGLTQECLATQMQLSGCDISRGTLAKIEAGIRHISIEELRALKEMLNITYDDLFGK